MDSDDDFELFSDSDAAAPPVRQTKLKRLKKGITVPKPAAVVEFDGGGVKSSEFEALSLEESNGAASLGMGSESLYGLGGEVGMISGGDGDGDGEEEIDSGADGFGDGGEIDSGFEGLGGEAEIDSGFDGLAGGEDGSGAKRTLDFESVDDEFGEKGEDGDGEMPEDSGDMGMEEADKKRRSFDGLEEEEQEEEQEERKKKSKRAKSETTAAKSERKTKKERRDQLNQLHAESQRLLRETRDAAFKPLPIVQKPISSVLEKIRKRKLEVSQKCSRMKAAIEEPITFQAEMGSSANEAGIDGSNDSAEHSSGENVSSQMDVDEVCKQTFRAPVEDTQDLFSVPQTTESKDDQPNDAPSNPLEDVIAPSILAMNLKLDSAPPDDISSDDEEEDYDKENIDPSLSGVADTPSSPTGDPVKAFVDEEAEEEDDSDHDMLRFQDSEEDEDDGDLAEFNDMIATGYEERPSDNERRNELHQKWLEQQDASGTEKLLQKLKFRSKKKETTLLEENYADEKEDADGKEDEYGEENADGEEDEESGDEAPVYFGDDAPVYMVPKDLKKIKQMIPLAFSKEDDDVYLSSEDDETEKRIAKHCLSEKTEKQATVISPDEDESSRQGFVIKKVNIVPTTKKAKLPDFFNTLGRDRGTSLKSSLIGQGGSKHLPSSLKQGFNTGRSIIFGRGDIISRSKSSESEDFSDTILQKQNLPTMATSAKFGNSKVQISTQKSSPETGTQRKASANARGRTDTSAEAALHADTSASSLHILRQTRCAVETAVDQIDSVIASFNLGRKSVQANRRV